MTTPKDANTLAVGSPVERPVWRPVPERDGAQQYLAASLRRYRANTGCTYPKRPCDFCAAFVAGWNGDTTRDSDSDIADAKRRGSSARKRYERSKTPNARANRPARGPQE